MHLAKAVSYNRQGGIVVAITKCNSSKRPAGCISTYEIHTNVTDGDYTQADLLHPERTGTSVSID
jgi:metallophosphoesterase superfamily enzyme